MKSTVRDVNVTIADKAVHDKLTVWGRYGERAIEQLTDSEIEAAKFSYADNKIQTVYGATGITYKDVKFVSEEVDAIWPRETDDEQAR